MSVGIDLVQVDRFANILKDKNKLNKMFTKTEISYFIKFSNQLTHIAGHFCAKEAFVKALKTGFGKEVGLLDVEVLHDENGTPYINLKNSNLLKKVENRQIELSISHTETMATAIVVIN